MMKLPWRADSCGHSVWLAQLHERDWWLTAGEFCSVIPIDQWRWISANEEEIAIFNRMKQFIQIEGIHLAFWMVSCGRQGKSIWYLAQVMMISISICSPVVVLIPVAFNFSIPARWILNWTARHSSRKPSRTVGNASIILCSHTSSGGCFP